MSKKPESDYQTLVKDIQESEITAMVSQLLNCILYACMGFLWPFGIIVVSLIVTLLFGYLGFRIYTYWKTPAGKAFYLGVPIITLLLFLFYQ